MRVVQNQKNAAPVSRVRPDVREPSRVARADTQHAEKRYKRSDPLLCSVPLRGAVHWAVVCGVYDVGAALSRPWCGPRGRMAS